MRVFFLPLAVALLVPVSAHARSFRVNQIPSAPESCDTCHTNGGGSSRNPFGRDVESTLNAGDVDWPTVCTLDSDGDGFSNGEELGDPDCTWQASDGRLDAVSLPADASSFPGSPDPLPEAGDDAGGCSAVPLTLWSAFGALVLLRRRNKKREKSTCCHSPQERNENEKSTCCHSPQREIEKSTCCHSREIDLLPFSE